LVQTFGTRSHADPTELVVRVYSYVVAPLVEAAPPMTLDHLICSARPTLS